MMIPTKIVKIWKKVFVVLCAMPLMVCAQVPGQGQREVKEDFSDSELERFVEVVKVQQQNQEEMISAIEDEGLNIQKFNEILQAEQGQQKNTDIAAEEKKKFIRASEKVSKIQVKMQENMAKSMSENELNMEVYSEIMYSYQNSPKVQEKVDMMLASE